MTRDAFREILILTAPSDLHAFIVHAALQRKGVPSRLWYTSAFGQGQSGTIAVEPQEAARLSLRLGTDQISPDDIRLVWARRPVLPNPDARVNPGDRRHVLQENSFFVQAAWWALSDDIPWVNPYGARRFAKSKINQLNAAKQAGLTVPRTLYSNDPDDIRAFVASCSETGAIYKPHRVSSWNENGREFLLHTVPLTDMRCFSDEQLKLCAGLFQERVPKAYELRVNVMGQFCLAARLDSQNVEGAEMDWRGVPPSLLSPSAYELSGPLQDHCINLLQRLGLVCGNIDFIVRPDGELVFLEVNEMGQFLWLERANPEIRLLDHFCQFLSSNPYDYSGRVLTEPVSYGELRSDAALMRTFEDVKSTRADVDTTVEWLDVLI